MAEKLVQIFTRLSQHLARVELPREKSKQTLVETSHG